MSEDNTYGVSEIVGSSKTSIDEAIRTAIGKASENRRHIRWFEVTQVRGHVEEGQVAHFQVTLKLGYTLED
ncbi:MAG: dodecin flavoprotein [Phenylobacterium sp. RIFCSPHIGHO2_01_FULL_69_31]|jgi:flavin-binding protein dodecin|uniref:dodecin n=1 Tax=Phenylobacterium sp. RIFCSPHIGHO2_01_FULL_69_31 TaxID=1801944 RepID=UPI0008AB730A|nr:dodecin [Phenylobacterium sp. RIFCSPHIGHO2_01_FULL_69_31]OHB30502.1 MAG: dodecin flavoprotein [Phenylobacterium sp. RIFCSPHIGHO2_01_FULL_69_31]